MSEKMTPEIRFRGFEGEWKYVLLGDISSSYSGGTPSVGIKEYYGGDIPFIRSAEINSMSTELSLTKFGLVNSSAKLVNKGDILYALYGATSGEVGRARINGAINQAILAIIPNQFNSPDFITQWLKKSKDSIVKTFLQGGQGNLSAAIVKDLVISSPVFNEQKRIGALFATLDRTIDLQRRKLEKLQTFKSSMLQKMFPKEGSLTPEIRFSGFQGEWKRVRLGDAGSTFTGLSGKTKNDFGHGKAKYVTYMNVYLNAVANLKMTDSIELDTSQTEVRKGDVFFTTSSETPEEVGMSCVLTEEVSNTYLNSFCFGYRPSKQFDLFFLAHLLRAKNFRENVVLLAQGISRYNISKNKVMQIEIPYPKLPEQKRIGALFATLDRTIDLQRRKLEKLQNLKQSLLQKMFV